jgi:hypothetical protein
MTSAVLGILFGAVGMVPSEANAWLFPYPGTVPGIESVSCIGDSFGECIPKIVVPFGPITPSGHLIPANILRMDHRVLVSNTVMSTSDVQELAKRALEDSGTLKGYFLVTQDTNVINGVGNETCMTTETLAFIPLLMPKVTFVSQKDEFSLGTCP